MNIVNRTILAEVAAAADSSPFECDGINPVTVILHSTVGLTAAEYADIQISHDDGDTWNDLYIAGTQQRLTSDATAITVSGPGLYQVAKEATTNAAGLTISHAAFPESR